MKFQIVPASKKIHTIDVPVTTSGSIVLVVLKGSEKRFFIPGVNQLMSDVKKMTFLRLQAGNDCQTSLRSALPACAGIILNCRSEISVLLLIIGIS